MNEKPWPDAIYVGEHGFLWHRDHPVDVTDEDCCRAEVVKMLGAERTVQIFYDLAHKVIAEARLDHDDGVGPFYVLDIDVRDDLAGFLGDFHDDNPQLWNLLTDEQRRTHHE